MNNDLESIAKALVAPGKGILAADESLPTIEKRFAAINLPNTPENRHAYRELLFGTPGIENYISGIIQFEETLKDKLLKNPNVISGIKVDQGTDDYNGNPDEKITKGIDTLSERLKAFKELGAKFTKWRAVFKITQVPTPSIQNVQDNAILLAKFAKLSQESGMVPIVEPEVLTDGAHDIEKCYETTRAILKVVFMKLHDEGVDLKGILLKPNMILPGSDSGQIVTPADIAHKTIEVLEATVPDEVPGIVFLSGGQTSDDATKNLNEMNKTPQKWQLSFSFGRALQTPVLKEWSGKNENMESARKIYLTLCENNSKARNGQY